MAFSKLYGLESEIKINRKITKTGSVGRREPENLFGVALISQSTWFPSRIPFVNLGYDEMLA